MQCYLQLWLRLEALIYQFWSKDNVWWKLEFVLIVTISNSWTFSNKPSSFSLPSIASSIHCVFVIFWLILFFRHAIQNEIYSGGLNKNSPHLFIWWGYGQLVKYINNGCRRTHIAQYAQKNTTRQTTFFAQFSHPSLYLLSVNTLCEMPFHLVPITLQAECYNFSTKKEDFQRKWFLFQLTR